MNEISDTKAVVEKQVADTYSWTFLHVRSVSQNLVGGFENGICEVS